MGQVMMLKDANSKKVIEAVKERVAEISKSLPKGVYINPFLERSELIAKTTFTVTENLILGCLIVIFVVVLLLGNFRSGLVVASVIPLCLLFALSLMYIFGVDANLMSLGAIDFGIIIDGAVIIVEFIAFEITRKQQEINSLATSEKQQLKDEITFNGASKMMNSAIFGQLIILIVFIPILSLSGVEGKMFKPMALTFSFALIGAMILCFTYVPVAASIFLKPSKESDKNISVRLMKWLNKKYEPIIDWALQSKKLVLGIASVFVLGAIFLYSTMGSEFVPTLDEGDFVIQPVLKAGTSLSKTVEITTEIEKILLKNFPEVQQVVTRIGAAEVPTDPMSMEESDVIIKLAPKGEWTSADSKDELAAKFKEALAVIPGMEVEFTQPIEMRFNELITGVRADIAIKIFGPDLDVLAKKGSEIGNLIKNVEGAADISVEKIAGLPEMSVNYDRAKIARFGLNIQELNDMVSMGFAGKTAGSVFEGERRFDLVVRLDKAKRQDIDDLKNLYVDLPMGGKVPLTELAEISYKKGAAKISRDDTKRRTVVGVNVRNRDLQSVVDDVQQLINEKVKLPAGYTITYGGQFENLQSARDRLIIAVPIALVLIFALLYFAFKSVKEALIIYSAIPLAAVGGVLLLWMRDLPFSISAGVGFIALFGIAVLNGIVLIEHFKKLKKHTFNNLDALIKQGTKDRLRAVLLTASAAALGFLPMAISTNAGAEVQRPLATVVIGGLFTATILTLVVLPVLYSIFDKYENSRKPIPKTTLQNGIAFIALLITVGVSAQETKGQNLDELLSLAIENNMGLKAGKLKVEESQSMINSAFNFNKTHVYYEYDENNLAINDVPLKVFGVQQDFRFPTEYFSQKRVNKERSNLVQIEFDIQSKTIERDVTIGYYEYQIAREKVRVYKRLDSLYANFSSVAARKFELGETNYLEKITAASKQRKINLDYQQAIQQVSIAHANLLRIIQVEDSLELSEEMNLKIDLKAITVESTPEIAYYETNMQLMAAESNFEKQQLLPDISVAYFQGSNSELNDNLIGYQLGLKIPLLFSGQAARIKASKIAKERAVTESIDYKIQIKSKQEILLEEISQIQNSLNYYENEGTELSDEILKTAQISFKNGEIDFYQYIQSLESAYDIKLGYLDKLKEYNETVININFLTL